MNTPIEDLKASANKMMDHLATQIDFQGMEFFAEYCKAMNIYIEIMLGKIHGTNQ